MYLVLGVENAKAIRTKAAKSVQTPNNLPANWEAVIIEINGVDKSS